MAVAEDSKDLFKLIKQRVEKKLQNEIKNDLKELYKVSVYDTVYRPYRTRQYIRRYTLLQIDSKYIKNESSLDIFSLGYPNYSNPDYGNVFDLLSLVEYGHGNNSYGDEYNMWDGSAEYGRPRPFNKVAIERAKKIDYQKYFR